MKKIAAAISFLIFLLSAQLALAQNPDIPERNGDFPDPEHPGVRVRVFVHEPKPSPTSSPILSCSDPDSSSIVPPTGWKLASSWTYNLNSSSTPSSVGSANLSTIAGSSFGAWSSAVSNKVNFAAGSNTTTNKQAYDGQNVVAWGRTSGTALAVTYTRYNSSTGMVVDVDTIFNLKFPWSWTNPASNSCSLYATSYDAQDILTHELGHWMGLDDTYDTSYANNTMYGYGAKGEVKKDTLTTGDISGVKSIYP